MNLSAAANVVSTRRPSIEGVFAGDGFMPTRNRSAQGGPGAEPTTKRRGRGHAPPGMCARGHGKPPTYPQGPSRREPPDRPTPAHLQRQAIEGRRFETSTTSLTRASPPAAPPGPGHHGRMSTTIASVAKLPGPCPSSAAHRTRLWWITPVESGRGGSGGPSRANDPSAVQ